MKVIVCGAGQVGSGIARQLASENNDVTVIDLSADLIRQVTENYEVQGITGHGSHPDVLERAGAAKADMLIAVTYADEVNMVACEIAHHLFSVPLKIARVRAQSYLDSAWQDLYAEKRMPIDVIISPEIEVARSVLRRLDVPGAFDTLAFEENKIQLVGTRIEEGCPVAGQPLRQLSELFPDLSTTVVGIVRKDKLHIPRGADHIEPGDEVYFVAEPAHVGRTLDLFGHTERGARRIIIVGGGNIGLFVAKELERRQTGAKVKLIEASKERAEAAADQLARTVVLHGDGLDQALLREAGVAEAETLVAVTNDDEVNILASVLGKRAGCRRSLALVNNQSYGPLLRSLGVDAFINPHATTVSTILQHVRRGRIRGLHWIYEGNAEAIEAEALETSPLVGKPLAEARIPDGMIIGAILRQGRFIRPRGTTVIETGDRVVIFARRDLVKKVEQLFRVSLAYF